MGYVLRKMQQDAKDACIDFFQNGKPGRNGIAVMPTGCHAYGTEILMADGSVKRVENVMTGDRLLGPDGKARNVLHLFGGTGPLCRITPLRGEPFIVNVQHVLSLVCTREGNHQRKAGRAYYKQGGERESIQLAIYLQKSKSWKHLRKLHRSEAVCFPDAEQHPLPLPPWIVGVLLGDGYSGIAGVSVTSADDEIIRDVKAFARAWWLDVKVNQKKNNKAVSLMLTKHGRAKHRMQPNPLRVTLRALGLDGVTGESKFIPVMYKTAGVTERLELLAGLIDTDGSFSKGSVGWVGGSYDYISKSKQLATDVVFVARSLGLYASIRECRKRCQTGAVGTYHRVHISGNIERVPCRIKRKQAPVRESKKNPLLTGFSVDPVGNGLFFGFELDLDHLYLTSDFTVHHNSGKSLVIANTVAALDAPALIFQPSKEILQQNLEKFQSYGFRPSIYSASMGRKTVGDVTLATIGSVAGTKGKNARASKAHLFQDFPYIVVDECDLVGSKSGQYKSFFEQVPGVKILGVTATPWRMSSDSFGTMAKFLTRTRPRIFSEVVWYTQVEEMVQQGYWAKLEYKVVKGFDRHAVKANSTGADFDERALQLHFFKIGFQDKIVEVVKRLKPLRKNALIFTRFVPEAEYVASKVEGLAVVTTDTHKAEREAIGREFREGRIWGIVNCGVYLVGFDYPELETVVLARPTKSLRIFYQQCGRGVRIHPEKESCWIVDMVGLTHEFGELESLKLYCEGDVKWSMWGKPGGVEEKQLTNVYLADSGSNRCRACGQPIGFWMRHEITANSAGLCRPPVGVRPNIVLRKNLEGKTVYAIPRPNDPDYGQREFILHRAICGKQLNGGQNG